MCLPDQIEELYRQSKIPRRFRVADVRPHLDSKFAENYISTALANYAQETGNYVQRWSRPRFRRVARGLYEISS